MKDQPKKSTPTKSSAPEHHGEVLAKLPSGEFDTEMEQTLATSSRADTAPTPTPVKGLGGLRKPDRSTTTPALPPPAPNDDQLSLPNGAIVAMRRSGGFRFTSRQVTVYQDGTVEAKDATPGKGRAPVTRRLRDKELAALYRLLDGAGLPDLPSTSGQQSPDGMAYEITARTSQGIYSTETFDGSIPSQLAPLIQTLSGYITARSRQITDDRR